MAEETEKIYVIPLKRHNYQTSKAAPTAMKRVKEYLKKHMKVDMDKIWIDDSLNQEIWQYGKFNMPNKIRVKAVKFDDGVVEAYLPELEFVKSRREIIQEEKAKKQPILLKEEEVEEEMETGAEDYDVVPTADGDVKIKKKKHEKEESEETSAVEEKAEKKPKAEKEESKKEKAKDVKTEKKSSPEKKEKPAAKKEEKPTKKADSEAKKEKPKKDKAPSEKKSSVKKTETPKEKKAEATKKESE